MAHKANDRHTDNWWLETIASAVVQDSNGVGTITTSGGGGGGGNLATASKGSTTAGSPTSTNASANRQPLDVTIYDASGNAISSFGGGTQYAEGVTTNPATGTAVLGRYTTTQPTLTNNQLSVPQLDVKSNQLVNLATKLDFVNDSLTSYPAGHIFIAGAITTATTTVVKTGAGVVAEILVEGGTLGNITVYDNTAASGTVIVPAVTPTAAGVILRNTSFTTGLTIVTAAATIVVVTYR